MAFDSAGFPNDLPAAPRKGGYSIDTIVAAVAVSLVLGVLVWLLLRTASDAFHNLINVAATSRLL
jgi:hypothetical protein